MSKCPYCKVDVTLMDFFEVYEKETKKGKPKTKVGSFKGDIYGLGPHSIKMWACPGCDTILGFSEMRF